MTPASGRGFSSWRYARSWPIAPHAGWPLRPRRLRCCCRELLQVLFGSGRRPRADRHRCAPRWAPLRGRWALRP